MIAGAAARRSGRSPGCSAHYDHGAASARLQGLPEVCAVCHGLKYVAFRNLADARLLRGAGQGDRGRIQDPGRPERPGRDVRARGPAGRLFPDALAERERRPRALQRRAARHVGARQGAQLRARLPVVHLRHVHPVPGAWRRLHPRADDRLQGEAAGRFHAAAGLVLQRVLPRPRDRDAAAARPTSASITTTARRPRSISSPRTSPRS